jgi:phospholipid transport system transporter-binding protein
MRVDSASIDMKNAAQIAAAGVAAIRDGDTAFDLSAVRSCDSSAIAVILAWRREAQARNVALEITNLPAGLSSLATVYGVAPLLNLGGAGD